MSVEWLSYLATALVLTSVYLISKPKLAGQYLILVADATWLTYALSTRQWALAAQSTVLACISYTAIGNWKKAGIK